VAKDMERQVIRDFVAPVFLAAQPPRTIASCEGGRPRSPAVPLASPMDEDIKRRLRSLGYVQ